MRTSSAPTRSGAPATSRRSGATSCRSIFPMPRRRRPPPTASPKGQSFDEIAKELGKTEKDIDLGTVAKAAVIDRAAADAAFALKEGEVSAPVQRPVRHRAGAGAQDRARAGSPLRAGRRRAQAGARHRARQDRDFRRLQQDRGRARGGQAAGRGRREPQAAGAHRRGDRPLRPRRRGHAREPPRSATAGRSVQHRRRRRARSRCRSRTAISGTTSPGSRPRASARSTRSRSRSRRAGASRRLPRASTPRRRKSWTSSRPARRLPKLRRPTASRSRP